MAMSDLFEFEEQVGRYWHRLIHDHAPQHYPDEAAKLADVAPRLAVYFRALGGDGGLQLEAAESTPHGARRSLRQRIAGSGKRVPLAWIDGGSLRLPPMCDQFPSRTLNESLYYWLAALAAQTRERRADEASEDRNGWFDESQQCSRAVLERLPGLAARYRLLAAAHLAQRPDVSRLPAREAAAEQAIRQALANPGYVPGLPPARLAPAPVPLWLHPSPPRSAPLDADDESDPEPAGEQRDAESLARRSTQPAKRRDGEGGLIAVRMENILSFGEHLNVDRSEDDEDDLETAEAVARDLDQLATTRKGKASTARLKFDLDLPSPEGDDIVLSDGLRLPEWDYRRGELLPDRCRVVAMRSAQAPACELPRRLSRVARKLRRQFEALRSAHGWRRGLDDGPELDLDACLRRASDRAAGQAGDGGLYRERTRHTRDLACLLLADLSLSTDTWVSDHDRVIDVIRDSLFLTAESLAACGDSFAMLGFSSRRRDPIRVHMLKTFDEPYDAVARGRIQCIKPGFYTRLGAAVRHSAGLLETRPAHSRLLLILTDGKPNDLDQYEGRYGIEDTREAVREARRRGLHVFCVTIDERGREYLPYLFGSNGYVVVRNPLELPQRLPRLYAQLMSA